METRPIGFDLPSCLQSIKAIEADLQLLTAGLTDSQFHAPSARGGWSIGYCIEHLILTGAAFVVNWDAALAASAAGHPPKEPLSYSWLQRRVLQFVEPPYHWKIKTPRSFHPCSRRSKEETVQRFLKMHREIAQRVWASQGHHPKRVKVQSPFVAWIWYPMGLSFDLALAHERRHLWQAWQIRKQFSKQ